jgi:hypothetical protein
VAKGSFFALNLEHRNVTAGISADHRSVKFTRVRQYNLYLSGTLDHVGIGDNMPVFVKDDAAADSLHLPLHGHAAEEIPKRPAKRTHTAADYLRLDNIDRDH